MTTPNPTHPAPDDGLHLPWREEDGRIVDERDFLIFETRVFVTLAQIALVLAAGEQRKALEAALPGIESITGSGMREAKAAEVAEQIRAALALVPEKTP